MNPSHAPSPLYSLLLTAPHQTAELQVTRGEPTGGKSQFGVGGKRPR